MDPNALTQNQQFLLADLMECVKIFSIALRTNDRAGILQFGNRIKERIDELSQR